MERTIAVIADDREPSAVIDALRRAPACAVLVQRLPLGDYRLDGCLLFERKTFSDFLASIKDGRLFQQAARLAAAPVRTAMILEGHSRDMAQTGFSRDAVQGALIALVLQFGIPLLRSFDAAESARLMLYSARQAQRYASGALPRPGKRPGGKRKIQLRILQEVPGIGAARADAVPLDDRHAQQAQSECVGNLLALPLRLRLQSPSYHRHLVGSAQQGLSAASRSRILFLRSGAADKRYSL